MQNSEIMPLRDYLGVIGLIWGSSSERGRENLSVPSPLDVAWNSVQDLSERELEAAQAALIALRDHFPELFRKTILRFPEARLLLNRPFDGRIIKLRRIAIAAIAKHA
jgi:hypothetical protein